ncbi:MULTISPECIES: cation-translocating P-type ATPase [unclassified Haladaptatus]|uniref:heavy metal translocating P-type ATPase n=1 Tax=unclassified Haladaptatus TaxID=2622732 RepID=UPI0023E75B3C|nr:MULTISPECIES: cation-translocating P-type ATPase [unclassified Haladaptatus]
MTAESSAPAGHGHGHREQLSLSVPEMDCASCAGKISNALDDVVGVVEYDLRPTTGKAEVVFDPDETTREAVLAAFDRAGYEVANLDEVGATRDEPSTSVWRSTRAKKTAVSGVFLLFALVFEFLLAGFDVAIASVLTRQFTVSDLLFLTAIVVGGQVILRNGYYSARNLNLDIDFLMSVAILAATGVTLAIPAENLFVEAGSIAVLFNVAELLERRSIERARTSLAELFSLAPETATVKHDGHTHERSVEELDVGDIVVVQPGEKIPTDGTVVEGESAVNQAPITGESVPIDKEPGDEVYAGTLNEAGYLEVEVTARADENTLARIIDLVESAQEKQTKREQFVERFAGYYTPVVVVAAILTAAIPPLLFAAPWVEWFVRGIALLVIACPCAFVISTPVTVVSGVTSAARNGVLIKGGNYLEAMGEVETVAFDKTGTLTTGKLSVTDVIPLNGNSADDVLECAYGVESRSEHPIAAAITEHIDAEYTADIDDFESLTGKGVRAQLGGETHYAGKPALFEDLGFDLDHVHFTTGAGDLPHETQAQCEREGCLDLVSDTIPRLQDQGKTVVLIGTADDLEGLIAVADTVRPEAKAVVAALKDRGVRTVMLTGDNEGTAEAVAREVGVDEFRASLLPEEKVDAIEALLAEYESVAMVGDGINDAPALATATVGIAMGAAGSATAIETADIALMGDDLSKLPYLYDLAHQANGVIRQNIWGSLAVKALLAVGIPLGFVSVVVAVLAGDVGMTTVVTGNAMRLSRIEPEDEVSIPEMT